MAPNGTGAEKDAGRQVQVAVSQSHATKDKLVYVNGEYVDSSSATLSVYDFAVCYAGGVYDVIPMYDGNLIGMDAHLDRLYKSCALVGIPLRLTRQELIDVCRELIRANQVPPGIGMVYIQVSFGAYLEMGRSHIFPSNPEAVQPSLVVFTQQIKPFSLDSLRAGIKIKSMPDERWKRCNIKSIALLPNIMDLNAAARQGFSEVVWSETDGTVTECSSSNIFCVIGGEVLTPPESNRILSGITRRDVLRLARANSILVRETSISLEELKAADEVFATSSTKEVCPVGMIDDSPVKQVLGPVTRRLMQLYAQYVEDEVGGSFVHWRRALEPVSPSA